MKTSTNLVLVTYVKQLQAKGITSVHLGSIIQCVHPKERGYRTETGERRTQFVDLEGALDGVATYDRSTGWIFIPPVQAVV